jgi:hypothetical protein
MDFYGGNMASQTMIESERNKQLRRIADALEKIAKCMNKRTLDNVVLSNDKVILTTNDKNITLPSLENWSKKDCINLFNLLKIKYSITGDGFVTSQSVKPGEVVTEGMEIEIELKNKYIEEAK